MAHRHLPRRERQILDIIYSLGSASAQQVRERLPDDPSYSAVRAALRGMEDKGLLRHTSDGPRHVYSPKEPKKRARRSALKHLVNTFFDGSTGDAVAALLDVARLDDDELERIAALIDEARKEGR